MFPINFEVIYLLQKASKFLVSPETLFRIGLFVAAHRLGEQTLVSSLKFVSHTLQWWNLAPVYITYRIYKKHIIHATHPLSSADIRVFFTRNQQFLLCQEMQIQFCILIFWYIVFNSFNCFWVFKDFFNKHGSNFYKVSKNGYSKHS